MQRIFVILKVFDDNEYLVTDRPYLTLDAAKKHMLTPNEYVMELVTPHELKMD